MEPNKSTSLLAVMPFEGHDLAAIADGDDPIFFPRQVGAALGYANDGRELATSLGGNFADRLRPGDHVRHYDGEALAALKSAFPGEIDPRTPRLTMLTERGLFRVLMLSGKPKALAFQDWLDGTLLPALRRGQAPWLTAEQVSALRDDLIREQRTYMDAQYDEIRRLIVPLVDADIRHRIASRERVIAELGVGAPRKPPKPSAPPDWLHRFFDAVHAHFGTAPWTVRQAAERAPVPCTNQVLGDALFRVKDQRVGAYLLERRGHAHDHVVRWALQVVS